MAKCYVTKTGKDRDGDITKLCNAGEIWSPRSKADAIRDIEGKVHEYFVRWSDKETRIEVVNDARRGKYLNRLMAARRQTPWPE